MTDRRRRTAFHHSPQPLPLAGAASPLLREDRSSAESSPSSSSSSVSSASPGAAGPVGAAGSFGASGASGPSGSAGSSGAARTSGSADDNPFAAPPEDRPDQPWQPRHVSNADEGRGNGGRGNGGRGEGDGSSEGGGPGDRPAPGGQWSPRQPGRQSGGFGGRPGGPGGQGGSEGGTPGGLRWDPTDPAQRRARYALLAGMWAFFFALFEFPEIALLLGALAVYWSISALRAKPREAVASTASAPGAAGATGSATAPGASAGGPLQGPGTGRAPAPGATAGGPATGYGRQQTTAAISGLVTALLALSIVATTYTVQLVYRDYYTCVNDALTKSGQLACNDLLPKPLEPLFGVKE